MPYVIVKTELPSISGLPRDVAVNSFCFEVPDLSSSTLGDVSTLIAEFYTGANTNDSLDYYLSATISRVTSACTNTFYDWSAPEPRVPIHVGQFTLGAPGNNTSWPAETSLCVSYRAQFVSGSPNARRRGRIYLGPLAGVAGETPANGFARPDPEFIEDCVVAAMTLATDSTAADTPWCVWSRVDGVMRPIIGGWVDNDFDTQRRREPGPSSRSNWSLSV